MSTIKASVRERPIVFTTEEVRAILAGWKTQTRRVIRPNDPVSPRADCSRCLGNPYWARTLSSWARCPECGGKSLGTCPYGEPGDRLYVKETWRPCLPNIIEYRADGHRVAQAGAKTSGIVWRNCDWRPSIHMPRWASRLTLRVESVRVERLAEICLEDVIAEGMEPKLIDHWPEEAKRRVPEGHLWSHVIKKRGRHHSAWDCPIKAFREFWNDINAKRQGCSWDDSPWVWVVAFSVESITGRNP